MVVTTATILFACNLQPAQSAPTAPAPPLFAACLPRLFSLSWSRWLWAAPALHDGLHQETQDGDLGADTRPLLPASAARQRPRLCLTAALPAPAPARRGTRRLPGRGSPLCPRRAHGHRRELAERGLRQSFSRKRRPPHDTHAARLFARQAFALRHGRRQQHGC
jgi:hypothetical protein